jgi:hypothetical protein
VALSDPPHGGLEEAFLFLGFRRWAWLSAKQASVQ